MESVRGQSLSAFVGPHGCVRWVGSGGFDAGEGKLVGAIQRSDDEGETWRLSATIERPDGARQQASPTVVQACETGV